MLMKTWLEDNCLARVKEANGYYLDDLKKLINGEAVAAIQYKIAADNIVGPDQSYFVEHFAEHSDDEWSHYTQLVSALMQREGEAESSLVNIINEAIPETEEIELFDSEYLRGFFTRAEENAIEAYQDFYDRIEKQDADLADLIIGIIHDERDHKLDMIRILDNPKKSEVQTEEESEEEPSDEDEQDFKTPDQF